ncbi:MAG: hypothetical protein KDC87_15610 [Planctomycetes bacterium]|nr:hypothetical protein [Planctomycetota bacterium]MCB9871382.1 hypothetical protein [Planctomycetota bacterium]MCB9888636.1 hypothetical protein [Planctomycetota bacterium]
MQLDKALAQISEIHAQVLKSEVFRGYRAATMAITGGVAVLAAAVQSTWVRPADAVEFVVFWVAVAAVCAVICASDLLYGCLRRQQRLGRWRSLLVVAQSMPALLVGGVVTAVLVQWHGFASLLPGLWALFFALGIWSVRPYLPKAIGVVAAFYGMAGTWMLVQSHGVAVPAPWWMGATFGVGQLAAAGVLYLNLERPLHAPEPGARRSRG